MENMRKKSTLGAALLLAITTAAYAQSNSGEPQALSSENARTAAFAGPNSSSSPKRARSRDDVRALWTDPQIRNFKGLSENDWDFSDPNGVPGFAPMETNGATR